MPYLSSLHQIRAPGAAVSRGFVRLFPVPAVTAAPKNDGNLGTLTTRTVRPAVTTETAPRRHPNPKTTESEQDEKHVP